MRVLLIYPDEPKDTYNAYSEVGSYLPPLGLASIAAVLEKAGHEVRIIDNSISSWSLDTIADKAKKFDPGCIGFSATSPMLPFTKKLAKKLKERLGDVPLVVGGPGITADKNSIWRSVIDFGIYGEGEYTFLEFISTLEKKKTYGGVRGLILNLEGKKKINPPRPYIKNLDELPMPAFHLLPSLRLYKTNPDRSLDFPIGTIVSSRGCPYNC